MKTQRTERMEKWSPSEELAAATAVAEAGPSHVLVVEDDEDCGLGLAIWLEQLGHAVTTIRDGAEAIRWIEDHEPALALMDLGLPGMHGLKLLHEIRMRGLATKVVVVTATAGHGIAAQAKALGAVEVLRKPLERTHLLAAIEDLLPDPEQETWRSTSGKPRSSRGMRLDEGPDVADLLMAWVERQVNRTRREVRP